VNLAGHTWFFDVTGVEILFVTMGQNALGSVDPRSIVYRILFSLKVQHQELKADHFSSSNAMISIEFGVLYQLLIAGCLDCDVIAFYCLFFKYHIASYLGRNRVCGS
jgi:hypothetical protein